jgi:hypothetical protein
VGQLIDAFASVVGMHVGILGTEVAPLKAIHGAKVPLLPVPEPKLCEELL